MRYDTKHEGNLTTSNREMYGRYTIDPPSRWMATVAGFLDAVIIFGFIIAMILSPVHAITGAAIGAMLAAAMSRS